MGLPSKALRTINAPFFDLTTLFSLQDGLSMPEQPLNECYMADEVGTHKRHILSHNYMIRLRHVPSSKYQRL